MKLFAASRTRFTILLGAWLSAACASAPAAPPEPASDPAAWQGDVALYQLLNHYPLDPARQDSVRSYLDQFGGRGNALLAEAATDSSAPSAVRANALLTLGTRGATTHMYVLRDALHDRDPRVRATAVAALREFLPVREAEAMRIARLALADSSVAVQGQALMIVSERDVELLRNYLTRAASEELRAVARDLIQVAEDRGAPLPSDSAGGLRRRTTHGYTLTFTPRQRYAHAGAAVGDVVIQRGAETVAQLSGIEAVGNIVPVFFSTDGDQLVYERERQIVVRDRNTGAERIVGPGIAPRPRPFTGDFIYFREKPDGRTSQRQQTIIAYEVLHAPFAAAGESAPQVLASTLATTSFERHGNYSPARWARVVERSGKFYLVAAGLEEVVLPDPFGGAARAP